MGLSTSAKGRLGEMLVMLELERRGWMVFVPHFEETIDLVAVRRDGNGFKHKYIQVKTARLRAKRRDYGIELRRKKFIVAPSFFYIWVLMEDEDSRPVFLVVPSRDVGKVMKRQFRTASWLEKGYYHFHINPRTQGRKWAEYEGRFDLLESGA